MLLPCHVSVAMASKCGRHSNTLPVIWPCERATSCGTMFLNVTPLDDESHGGHRHKHTPSHHVVIVIIALVVTLSTLLMNQNKRSTANGSMMYKSVLSRIITFFQEFHNEAYLFISCVATTTVLTFLRDKKVVIFCRLMVSWSCL